MQNFFPKYNAGRTGFGLSIGWQREIGLWNIAMIVILLRTLIAGDKKQLALFQAVHLF